MEASAARSLVESLFMRSGVTTFDRARRLRRDMSRPEAILWSYLRNHGIAGMHFRRQHAIGPYILDFYCASLSLCIEIDGLTHSTPEAARHDDARTAWLEARGIHVVRFAAQDVLHAEGLSAVLTTIESLTAPSTA
jgi:very-short-patch-repair endonuclease